MKDNLHPPYHHHVRVICACGNEFVTGSVLKGPLRVEICSACHPFFTGEKKYVDTEGRVEKFQRRQLEAQQAHQAQEERRRARARQRSREKEERPLSLKEMLEQARQ